MKKRILSIICALALCLTLLPVTALADGITGPIPDGLQISSTTVTDYTGTDTELEIPEGVTEIGYEAFLDSTVQEVKLPSTLTTIGEKAFERSSLTSITIPENVTTIREYAFRQSALTSITIPESVTVIGKYAFSNTKSLVRATILGNPTLGEGVFMYSGIQSIEMDQVTAISYQCFAQSSLTSISMNSAKSIGESAFTNTKLTEFTVPDTVESIDSYFLDFVDLDKLTVSMATLQKTGIHENAFANISSGCDVVLTGVNTDITLLDGGFSVGDETYPFLRFSINTVQNPSDCVITNQTGEDVSVVVDGETITLADGNIKPVGSVANGDAYLTDLTVTAGSSALALTPSFTNPETAYTAQVDNETASVSVTAQPSNSAASVFINGQAADADNSYTVDVALDLGENLISIEVTAPDGTTQKTYTVTVTRNEAVPQHLTISTAEELMEFAAKINDGTYVVDATADMVVELTADIDMSGYDWIPIGNSDTQFFAGTFDGNDHTISNLNMSNDSKCGNYLGLFGMTMAAIRDVHVSGEFFDKADGSSNYWFGSIAGCTEGDVTGCTSDFTVHGENDKLRSQIIGGIVGYGDNIYLENCVSSTSVSGYAGGYLGGIAGYADTCELVNCRNEGSFNITGTSEQTQIGGIAGQICGSSTLDHCVNNGNIVQTSTSLSGVTVGGICGYMWPTDDSCTCQITNCTNNGSVETQAQYAAGIVGRAGFGYGICTIKSCLNNGAIASSCTSSKLLTGVSGLTSYCPNPGSLTACISLGSLSAELASAIVHPVAAVTSVKTGFDIRSNYYDSSLTIQDTNNRIHAAVTAGSIGMSLTDLETEDFIQQVNAEGGNFRLDEDGHIEVIPLSYTLTVAGSYADVSGAGEYEEGEQVAIDAGSRPGYSFAGWTATSGTFADDSSTSTTFTMPAADTTITAAWSYNGGGSGGGSTTYAVTAAETEHGQVALSTSRASRGTTVTVTVTADEGYELESLTVTDADGNELELTDKGGGKYTFTMPASKVTVEAVFAESSPALPFTDVPEDYWAHDEIAWAYENGYMSGTSATTFNPGGTVTRQQVWMILARLSGADPADMAEARTWAVASGISDGTNPGGAVTRQQLAALLYRYAVQFGYDVSVGEDTNILSYADAFDVAEYAVPAMQWACGAGILNGTGDGSTLSPQGSATRAQLAVMLYRWLA